FVLVEVGVKVLVGVKVKVLVALPHGGEVMGASAESTLVGGCLPSARQLQRMGPPPAIWKSKVFPLVPVTATPAKVTLETGASATAHIMPGLLAPLEAVEAVMFLSMMLLQKGVVLVMAWVSSVVGGKEDGLG